MFCCDYRSLLLRPMGVSADCSRLSDLVEKTRKWKVCEKLAVYSRFFFSFSLFLNPLGAASEHGTGWRLPERSYGGSALVPICLASVTFQNGGQIKVVFEEEQEVIWIAHYPSILFSIPRWLFNFQIFNSSWKKKLQLKPEVIFTSKIPLRYKKKTPKRAAKLIIPHSRNYHGKWYKLLVKRFLLSSSWEMSPR